ncbi:MAG TPA: hypothetical protein VJU60_08665 [Thermoleophilaceae bacterium]|nr:hypothetical protein [Thermoleophilaceae bacterium]
MTYMTAQPSTAGGMTAVARLPLPDALESCLELLDTDPERFERASLRWHARLPGYAPGLTFTQVRAALDALEGLQTPAWSKDAHELVLLCARAGLEETAEALERWRRARLHDGAHGRFERLPSV